MRSPCEHPGGGNGGARRAGVAAQRAPLPQHVDLLSAHALRSMIQRNPGAKGLVFSQFTSMLDLCFYRCAGGGRGARSAGRR